MSQRSSSILPSHAKRRIPILAILALLPILLVAAAHPSWAAEGGTPNQCVACHTDAAKLKALTPPDPPVSEAGEG
ncbi:MAG: hypothetical protein HY713_03630 [candidate division NC10 bacterium]|nr:hypothetical protein [candidate division NC10 bacterium]